MRVSPEVDKNTVKYEKKRISGRTLRLPGLKPSDYFLLKEIRELYQFDLRQVLVLGLRLVYTLFHEESLRAKVYAIAEQVKGDDLDIQGEKVVYRALKDFLATQRR